MRVVEHVPPITLKPCIEAAMAPGPWIDTNADESSRRWEPWGEAHQTVGQGRGAYARDADGDGVHEVHVQTMEGCWSRLRSWRRPQRGLSQDYWPWYGGFCACVHTVRRRGQA
jgi:transposase